MNVFKRSALLVLIGAGIAAVVSSRTWVQVSVSDEALPLTDMSFTGRQLVPTAHALIICVVVLVLGMALSKTIIRRFLAGLNALVSLLAIVEMWRFLSNTSPAISELVASALGRELVQSAVTVSFLPYLGMLGLLGATIANVLIVVSKTPGSGLSAKYDRPDNRDDFGGNPHEEVQINPWAALDAGIDPTI